TFAARSRAAVSSAVGSLAGGAFGRGVGAGVEADVRAWDDPVDDEQPATENESKRTSVGVRFKTETPSGARRARLRRARNERRLDQRRSENDGRQRRKSRVPAKASTTRRASQARRVLTAGGAEP